MIYSEMNRWNVEIETKNLEIINVKLAEIANSIILKETKTIGLLGGDLGLILYLYQYMRYTGKDELLEIIERKISRACNYAASSVPTFCSGLAGLGWMFQYFDDQGFLSDDISTLLGNIDFVLDKWMVKEMNNGNYDFLHGAMGVAYYFQTRKSNKLLKSVETFLDLLESKAEKNFEDNTIRWKSYIEQNSRLVYNLSLSHGMASIVSFLSILCNSNLIKERASELLRMLVNYLINNRNPDFFKSSFSSTLKIETLEYNESRLAWCYGDLGIAFSLYKASRAINDKQLMQLSIDVLKKTTCRKDPQVEIVYDACFCHGSSGIMHIYNRMYKFTSDTAFKDAANYWLDVTLSKVKEGKGVAGFQFYNPVNNSWESDFSILNGGAGIGLALLGIVDNEEPLWDECLLLGS
jgi:lantibiotic modifying enzyme